MLTSNNLNHFCKSIKTILLCWKIHTQDLQPNFKYCWSAVITNVYHYCRNPLWIAIHPIITFTQLERAFMAILSYSPRFLCCIILTPPTQHLCLEKAGVWCLTGLENGKQVVKRTGMVGHKFQRLVVESLSDIDCFLIKLLTYHFLIKNSIATFTQCPKHFRYPYRKVNALLEYFCRALCLQLEQEHCNSQWKVYKTLVVNCGKS